MSLLCLFFFLSSFSILVLNLLCEAIIDSLLPTLKTPQGLTCVVVLAESTEPFDSWSILGHKCVVKAFYDVSLFNFWEVFFYVPFKGFKLFRHFVDKENHSFLVSLEFHSKRGDFVLIVINVFADMILSISCKYFKSFLELKLEFIK